MHATCKEKKEGRKDVPTYMYMYNGDIWGHLSCMYTYTFSTSILNPFNRREGLHCMYSFCLIIVCVVFELHFVDMNTYNKAKNEEILEVK